MLPSVKHKSLDPQNDDIEGIVDDIVQAPTVAFFVDLHGIKHVLQASDYAEKMVEFGTRLGRLSQFHIFDKDQIIQERKEWRRRGATVHTIHKGASKDVLFSMAVMDAYHKFNPTMFVFAVTDSRYQDLARYVADRGKIVVLLSPEKSNTNFIRSYCYFSATIEAMMGPIEEPISVDNYDFADFILLLEATQDHLPFVGVKYFIEKQMQRLGIADIKIRRQLIQKAKEEDIIEFGSMANIEGRQKPVTTCSLNKKNDLVKEVLEIEMYDEDEDGRTMTVRNDSITITEESKPSETVTFTSGDFSDIDLDETDSMPG